MNQRRIDRSRPAMGGPLLDGQQQAALVGVDHPVKSGAELMEAVDAFTDLLALRAQRTGLVSNAS